MIERFASVMALAFLRYLPAVALPAVSPLRWAPGMVRIVLALGLAWLTVLAMPAAQWTKVSHQPLGWIAAALSELTIGLVFGLAIQVPQAALHFSGWLVDVQAGLSAVTLFNPGAEGDMQSPIGSALTMVGTVLFFMLDLHLDFYRMLVASVQVLPVGQGGAHLDMNGLFGLIGSSFLLGLMVVAPVMLGLFAVDVGVAYASRSMPQANIYFLVLPLKIMIALLLLAATLPLVPMLLGRLYHDAFNRVPTLLGA